MHLFYNASQIIKMVILVDLSAMFLAVSDICRLQTADCRPQTVDFLTKYCIPVSITDS